MHTRLTLLLHSTPLQAAPVAAAFMGYPGPTGSPSIHYTYLDGVVAPPAHAPHFTERLALLPHTYYLNDYRRIHTTAAVACTSNHP